jgi:hypothetical protein
MKIQHLSKKEFRNEMKSTRAEYVAALAKAKTPQERRTLRRAIQVSRELEIAA